MNAVTERASTFANLDAAPRWEALGVSDCLALASVHYGTRRGLKAALYARAKRARVEGKIVTALRFEGQAEAIAE